MTTLIPRTPRSLQFPQTPDDESWNVQTELIAGDTYRIVIRDHEVFADQPVDVGGEDVGPTPTELFIASLASCVAFYAGRYLTRHHLPRHGLRVDAEYELATDRPARVGSIRLRLTVPSSVPAERRAALLAVAEHCTVHNTLRLPPEVDIALADPPVA